MLLGSYFSISLSVALELLQLGAVLAEFFNGLLHLGTQAVKIVFRLLDKGIQNVLDEFISSLSEIIFEFAGVEFNELFIFGGGLQPDIIDVVVNVFNHSAVSTDWVVDALRFDLGRVSLDEALAASVGSHRLNLFDFTGVLPHTAISLHLGLDFVNNFSYMVGQHVDVFALGDLFNIGLIIRLPLVGFGKGLAKFVGFPPLLVSQVVVVVVSAHGATRIRGVFLICFVHSFNNLSVLVTENCLKTGYNTC